MAGHSVRVVSIEEPRLIARLELVREQERDLRAERAAAVFAALEAGVPHRRIAAALGVTRQAVGQYASSRRTS